jgi:hypothetical protein
MSKVRNISGGPRYVPLLDREVADGEVADVPDFQPAHNPTSSPGDQDHFPIIWPEVTWEPVTEPQVAPEKPAKASKGE